jgi:hypothetical protein
MIGDVVHGSSVVAVRMIRRKAAAAEAPEAAPDEQPPKRRRSHRLPNRLPKGPLEVRVTMRFKFGEQPDDVITMMDDRRIPMVDSVFRNRDRIIRSFVKLLVKAGMAQPRVARELLPVVRFLRRPGS